MNMRPPLSVVMPLDTELLRQARKTALQTGQTIITVLADAVGEAPRSIIQALGQRFGMKVIETTDMFNLQPAFELIPLSLAQRKHTVFLRTKDQCRSGLIAVISDPFDVDLQTWLAAKADQALSYVLALNVDVQAFLSKHEESARAIDQIQTQPAVQADKQESVTLSFSSVTRENSPAVRLVNSTLYDGLKSGASDVHLETTATGLAIKYRIDGVLDNATVVQGIETAEQVISRLKVLSELDISERRIPQDGSFRVNVDDREIDLRVSVMPSIHGEDAVIRILDKRSMIKAYGSLTLEALGFDTDSLQILRHLTEEAYGMLMVTGPTGSGKTTTLYAALTEINHGKEKIITIEDPVEYQLPGILQIPVNEKKGLTFAKGLRSILRHDPDKIMVGEIRDKDTAEIAVQSALTGHLVLTTVHANNVFDVFGRFTHLGTDIYAFVSALNGIWAQRLIRLNCPHCSVAYLPESSELAKIKLSPEEATHFQFKRGQGCGDCRGTGYKGRKAIAEILILTDEIREMIVEKRPIRQIKELARQNGTRSLREAALELIKRGETTPEEIKRVTLHA